MYLNSNLTKSSSPVTDKLEHEMYLNLILPSPAQLVFYDKLEHEMYLNTEMLELYAVGALINWNMRCI